jgi:hypothetical protein
MLSKTLLFLSSQIRYTTRAGETLLILSCRPFLLEVRPLIALFRVAIFLVILNQHLTFLHRKEVQSQAMKRWL